MKKNSNTKDGTEELTLCRSLPKGTFDNSEMVFNIRPECTLTIHRREWDGSGRIVPNPSLQEILEFLSKNYKETMCKYRDPFRNDLGMWFVSCRVYSTYDGATYSQAFIGKDTDPKKAALRLIISLPSGNDWIV